MPLFDWQVPKHHNNGCYLKKKEKETALLDIPIEGGTWLSGYYLLLSSWAHCNHPHLTD